MVVEEMEREADRFVRERLVPGPRRLARPRGDGRVEHGGGLPLERSAVGSGTLPIGEPSACVALATPSGTSNPPGLPSRAIPICSTMPTKPKVSPMGASRSSAGLK